MTDPLFKHIDMAKPFAAQTATSATVVPKDQSATVGLGLDVIKRQQETVKKQAEEVRPTEPINPRLY